MHTSTRRVRCRDRKLLAQYRNPTRLKLGKVPDTEVFVCIRQLALLYKGRRAKVLERQGCSCGKPGERNSTAEAIRYMLDTDTDCILYTCYLWS